jgi:hypothetical protein
MNLFTANVGGLDRTLRITAGLAGLAMTQWGPATPWGLLGLVPLLTGALGTCPLYTLLGFRTCPLPNAPKH